MAINRVNVVDHRQEEEMDQEEAQDQEEQDQLHQEEGQEEAIHHQGAPHHSRQEERAIQAILHLHLQGFHRLRVSQIHGVSQTDPGNLFQS